MKLLIHQEVLTGCYRGERRGGGEREGGEGGGGGGGGGGRRESVCPTKPGAI